MSRSETAIPKNAGTSPAPDGGGDVFKIESLTMAYGDYVVMRDLDFSVKRGEIFFIIGGSGCGKSTLLKILLGWLPGYQGKVLYDERDVRDYTPEQLQQKMSYIEQNVFLFNTTIRENITLGEHFTDEQMEKALRDSALAGDLANMPKGLDTPVGEEGNALSGGQKQRVAIAGVVAMRPDCLILDEATAMLDPRGREQVMQTIHHLNKDMGITVVSITHYMEEAAQADRVLVMSGGKVVMEGTPKEVFSQTEKVRALRLDVPQAAELRDELVKAGIPLPEGIIDTGECAQALYELLK